MVALIVLAGLHGTGKTTLAGNVRERLAREGCRVAVVSEVARGIIESNGYAKNCVRSWAASPDKTQFMRFQKEVLVKQDAEEQAALAQDTDVVILDRGVDSIAYAYQHGGEDPANALKQSPEAQRCLERYQKGLVVFLQPVGPPEDDGVRLLLRENEDTFIDFYKSMLSEHHVPHVTLCESDREGRAAAVRTFLDGVFLISDNVCVSTLKLRKRSLQATLPYFEMLPDGTSWCPTVRLKVRRCDAPAGEASEAAQNRFMGKFRDARSRMCVFSFHPKVPAKMVRNLLDQGVYIDGKAFWFLGCTSSGMKQRRCYLYQGTVQEIDGLLAQCGNFAQIPKMSKRLARIGLLFSTCNPAVRIPEASIKDIHDIENDRGQNFTDGCGLVGKALAKRIMKAVGVETQPPPSVIQIRFQGYKGVVSVEAQVPKDEIHLRGSMKKFQTSAFPVLCVCNYSQPYSIGSLNLQFIRLLSTLGVPDQVFFDRLESHYTTLMNAQTDITDAIVVLSWKGKFEAALSPNPNDAFREARNIRLKEVGAKKQQLRILLRDSRQLFGIADHKGLLQCGQVHVRVTIDGHPQTIRGKVVVSKCPAYLPGDVRVLEAVSPKDNRDLDALEELVDCIVFPSQGGTPHPHEIAGSDLDGDEYFVCWDSGLIPPRTEDPYPYPEGTPPKLEPESNTQYFSKQGGGDVGKIDTLFGKWADARGAGCEQCRTLGKLFSQAIDAAKNGNSVSIPQQLTQPPEVDAEPPFVWTAMLGIAAENRAMLQEEAADPTRETASLEDIPQSFVEDLLESTNTNVTEYQKFRFAHRWCEVHDANMERDLDAYNLVDFGQFTADQLEEAIEAGVPRDVAKNAINKSELLTAPLKARFSLGTAYAPWRLWLRESIEDLDMRNLFLALTKYSKVMIVLDAGSGIIVGLQFNKKCDMGNTKFRNGQLSAYMHSKSFGDEYVFGTPLHASQQKPYQLNLTGEVFQLYEGGDKMENTFVWMQHRVAAQGKGGKKRGKKGGGKQSKGAPEAVENELLQDRVSIDLGRFKKDILRVKGRTHPKVTKTPVCSLEIFVQDRDVTRGCYGIFEANTDMWVVNENVEDDYDDTVPPCEDWRPHLEEVTQAALSGETCVDVQSSALCLDKLFQKFGHADSAVSAMRDALSVLVEVMCSRVGDAALADYLRLLAALSALRYDNLDTVLAMVKDRVAGVSIDHLVDVAMAWPHLVHLSERTAFELISVLCEKCEKEDLGGVPGYLKRKLLAQMLTLTLEMNANAAQAVSDTPSVAVCKLVSRDEGVLIFRLLRQSASHLNMRPFQPGTALCIGKADAERALCTGRIDAVDPQALQIVVRANGTDQALLSQQGWDRRRWALRVAANITDHERIVEPLRTCELSSSVAQYLCHAIPGTHSDATIAELHPSVSLNDAQRAAVSAAVSNSVTLIQGPPGTGKTQVLSEIVNHLVKSTSPAEGKVLVIAQTNIAVDNAVRRLKDMVSVVRVGLDGVATDLLPLSTGILQLTDTRRGSDGKQYADPKMVKRVLRNASAVCATVSGAGSNMLSKLRFHAVVVDEATQCLEASLLPGLVRGCNKLVLIGDTQQLPPMNPLRERSVDDFTVGLRDLAGEVPVSLFHRLTTEGVAPQFLNIQHRMHPRLASFVSREFYDGALQDGVSEADRAPSNYFSDPSCPVCYYDVQGSREEHCHPGTSYQNRGEAVQVAKVVVRLLSDPGVSITDICVLTPYAGQVKCVQEELRRHALGSCEVSTIDAFQGKEKEYIVFTTVRANPRGNLGFTGDPKRINVLLTRCRRGIIGVCDAGTLQRGSDIWSRWLKQAAGV
eukprot:TRINITY_DN65_c1_g1_i2.p1 TRINITY_DN65_c1_g1~~TRINITY_DN65_c1_g1_i2.p1  ORF type:complete len:1815 (+),score=482.44 TRINITY_DN65_c1_g1_i2:105-5549(+)